LAKIFTSESNVVGQAYQGFVKCREMELKARSAERAVEQTCPYPGARSQYFCSRNTELLQHYEGYLDNYCSGSGCTDGALRCMRSINGETEWLQECRDDSWQDLSFCHEGCQDNECLPEEFDFRLSAHPSITVPGRSSFILVEIYRRNGQPVPDIEVEVGVNQGVLLQDTAYTDMHGQAMFPWIAGTRGYATVNALAQVGDILLTDSALVQVN
jgi:hypothetical protein